MSWNELAQKCYKGALVREIRSENLSTVNTLYYFPDHDLISGQEVSRARFLGLTRSHLRLQLSGSRQKERAAVFEFS